jgi:hypothetical protein
MSASALRSAGVVAVAAVAGLASWTVARLLGVELTVETGLAGSQVGAADVILATVVAGLAAWGMFGLLNRTARTARWWPFVGSTGISLSMLGPSYLADGAAAMALMSMHLIVGAVLIAGFARFVPHPPYWMPYERPGRG